MIRAYHSTVPHGPLASRLLLAGCTPNRARSSVTRRRLVLAASALLALALLSALGCGSDYTPPPSQVTGAAPESLGKVYDIDARFGGISYATRGVVPTTLHFALALESSADGSHAARVTYEDALVGGERLPVENLTNDTVTLTISGDQWRSGRFGPVMIDGSTFEFIIEGAKDASGWSVSGETWQSQSGTRDHFDGWRRHRFLVAGTDYLALGQVALVELRRGSTITQSQNLVTTSPDPLLRQAGDQVFAINRLSYDNVQRLDPDDDFRAAWQASLGAGANPHDVALGEAGRLFVTRYEPPFHDLAVLDGTRQTIAASIPLESLAENADGYPRADRALRVGDTVFVGLQDIGRSFTEYADGKLAVVDAIDESLIGSIVLPGKNPGPILPFAEDGREKLLVALGGVFPGLLPQELSGGVAVVDVPNRVFERWALDDDALGGNVAGIALAGPSLGYVIVSDARYISRVLPFDPQSGAVGAPITTTQDFLPEIAASSGGVLAIPDRGWLNPGLCLHRGTSALAPHQALGCVSLALPPASVISLDTN